MLDFFSDLISYVPSHLWGIIRLALIIIAVFAGIHLVIKLTIGKESPLNRAICAAIGIIFIYGITILIYKFNPAGLNRFLAPLPYITITENAVHLFSLTESTFKVICKEFLSMVILAFLFDLMDDFVPRGKKFFQWLLFRVIAISMAMVLHYLILWIFYTFLPGSVTANAPIILLVILISSLLIGALKGVLGLVLIVINPIIGALYTFFFATKMGKGLSKAVFTTLLLTVLIALLHYLGFGSFSIAISNLWLAGLLFAAILLLWYWMDHE